MTISCLGALANILSLLVWIPQAKTTWKKRKEVEALSGISLWTQFISAITSLTWCLYGLLIHDIWLPLGSIVVVPLAVWTIFTKYRAKKMYVKELLNEKNSS
ncbi:PQ-loop domain-containing transporter [Lactococcus formosensis subsp. bovis]|uniref:PQ-loop domain-containing transporter n=1 Tax=Lactococcus formosensis TaxID=1281486 RepID=UPI001BD168D2|nr:PQ-loop domain-containing transporter [Lactococcus formosensis]